MELTCKNCGLIDSPLVRENPPHFSAFCKGCGKWIKHVSVDRKVNDFTLYFGKFKDRNIQSMLQDKQEREYLVWLYDKATTIKQWQSDILKSVLHV